MKRIVILIIAIHLVGQCLAQEVSFKNIPDDEVFEILNNAEKDINSLSKTKERLAEDYKKNNKEEALKVIEDMEFKQLLLKIENDMYNRMDLRPDETPYHYIAKTGKLEYLQFHSTFFKNYDINLKTDKIGSKSKAKQGNAPIHYAISRNQKNSLETVKALVEKGAIVNLKDEFSNTCLHLSAQENDIELVKYFLNKGLNINDTNILGNTALHKAAANKNKEMVDLLLLKGATMDEVNFRIRSRSDFKDYSTILHAAVMNNWTDIIDKAIKANVSVDCKVYKSRYYNKATPLLYAVDENNIEMTKYLIEKGANVDFYEHTTGYTPITKAVANENIEIFDILTARNANINIPTPHLNGFLIYHSFHCQNKETGHYFAKTILSNSNYLDPNSPEAKKTFNDAYINLSAERLKIKMTSNFEKDNDDKSPLHWCAIMGWDDLCELLIQKGTNVDITDKNGATPLQKAVQYKNYKTAKILIKHLANPKLQNKYGDNAFDIAKEKKDGEMKKVLNGK